MYQFPLETWASLLNLYGRKYWQVQVVESIKWWSREDKQNIKKTKNNEMFFFLLKWGFIKAKKKYLEVD